MSDCTYFPITIVWSIPVCANTTRNTRNTAGCRLQATAYSLQPGQCLPIRALDLGSCELRLQKTNSQYYIIVNVWNSRNITRSQLYSRSLLCPRIVSLTTYLLTYYFIDINKQVWKYKRADDEFQY